MVYITVKNAPVYKQMTIEDLLYGDESGWKSMTHGDFTSTKTYKRDFLNKRVSRAVDVGYLTDVLKRYNSSTESLREQDRESLYETFYIPKKSGGLRRIDAPKEELKGALRTLKQILEQEFGVLYHTSAYAYIRKRSTVDCVKKHQQNASRWFAKYDLHDFFGSTTLPFVMSQLAMIFPFCEVVKSREGREALETALELGFLNGGLPQGTPLSPLITNLVMIPIDFEICNLLRGFNGQRYVYTRYADDFIISSRYDFEQSEIQNAVTEILQSFEAPFELNTKKTRYGSSSGSNWNLGVMLNKDNEITIGHKKKRHFQCMVWNFARDTMAGNHWRKEEVQYLMGLYSYYRMVEKDNIDGIVRHLSEKANADIVSMMKGEVAM